jgi:hypothetical protein
LQSRSYKFEGVVSLVVEGMMNGLAGLGLEVETALVEAA